VPASRHRWPSCPPGHAMDAAKMAPAQAAPPPAQARMWPEAGGVTEKQVRGARGVQCNGLRSPTRSPRTASRIPRITAQLEGVAKGRTALPLRGIQQSRRNLAWCWPASIRTSKKICRRRNRDQAQIARSTRQEDVGQGQEEALADLNEA